MGSVKKRTYWKTAANGERVRAETRCYYASYTAANGKTERVKGSTDKRATQALLAQLEEKAARKRAGIPDPHQVGEPLDTLLTQYLAVLEARDTSPEHRAAVESHVTAALVGAKWVTLDDVTLDGLQLHLGRLKRKGNGRAGATLNAHFRSARAFVRWVARREKKPNPLDDFRPFNAEVGRKRSRVILTDDQLAALLASCGAHRPRTGMPGPDKRLLYEVAAYTGFRASELAALTAERFLLAGPCPGIYIPADATKGKAEAIQPLPEWLVARLVPWLAGKPPKARVWPGGWARNKQAVKILERDMVRAGLPTRDTEGRRTTFHSLRRLYITNVVESGATIREAMELARHSTPTLTFAVYAQTGGAKKQVVVNRLKPPGG